MESFEAYLTDTEAQSLELMKPIWDLGVAVFSAHPYNRTFIDGCLVGQAGGVDLASDPNKSARWQIPKFDAGINKWWIKSATEFNYSQPRQDAILGIVQGFPSVEIVVDFVETVIEA
tara:strand:+ start:3569 stop:3919 length:351 start_codon:yes stop_codon:yes gene_type:complete